MTDMHKNKYARDKNCLRYTYRTVSICLVGHISWLSFKLQKEREYGLVGRFYQESELMYRRKDI